MQMDGSFGIAGTVAEMLIQSHDGVIHLLPALPSSWARGGTATSLRARGGYAVDVTWKIGDVTVYSIRRLHDGGARTVRVRVDHLHHPFAELLLRLHLRAGPLG